MNLDPKQSMLALQKQDVETQPMAPGHYEIAKAILVLAFQVSRVADSVQKVVHQRAVLVKKRN